MYQRKDYNKQDINNDFCILKPTEPMQLESDPNADFACLPSGMRIPKPLREAMLVDFRETERILHSPQAV